MPTDPEMNINFKKSWLLVACISTALLTVPAEAEELEWEDWIGYGKTDEGDDAWNVKLIIPSHAKKHFWIEYYQVVDGETTPLPEVYNGKDAGMGGMGGDSDGGEAADTNKYYEILGVEKSATQQQIKKAFRKLARQLHPDKHPGEEDKYQHKFQELQKAYETLSEPEKRKLYDRYVHQSDFPQQNFVAKSLPVWVRDKDFTGDTRILKIKVVYQDDSAKPTSAWSKEMDLREHWGKLTSMVGWIVGFTFGGSCLVFVVAIGCCVHKRNKRKKNRFQQPVTAIGQNQV